MPAHRPESIVFSEIEATGEAVLYDPVREKATVVSPMAAVVWLLCDGHREVTDICREVSQALGPRESMSDEVQTAIDEMVREGLLLGD